MPTFSIALQAALLVFGVLWCREMLPRWRTDLARLRGSADATERGAIVILWIATVGIVFFCVVSLVAIVRGIGEIRAWFV